MISSTASLYFGKEDSLRTQYPREVNVQLRLSSLSQMEDHNLDLFRTAAQQAVEGPRGEMQDVMDYRTSTPRAIRWKTVSRWTGGNTRVLISPMQICVTISL